MWNVKTKVIPVKMGQIEPSQNHYNNTEQHTWKKWYQGTTENSHIGHYIQTHTFEGIKVEVWNVSHGK